MQDSTCRFVSIGSRLVLYSYLLLGTSCTPATPTASLEPLRVQYSLAARPWLAKLNNCAGKNVLAVEPRAEEFQDPKSVDLVLRVGQPDNLIAPAYQIGTDDLLVIVNQKNPLVKLTTDQVRALFIGQIHTWNSINGIDAPVQVWVFPAGEDVQQIFERSVLDGTHATSLARMANSPEEILQAVSNDADAIGIITRRLETGNIPDIFTAASSLPVLAITQTEPQGDLAQILACLQR
jgi:hypothetical protein